MSCSTRNRCWPLPSPCLPMPHKAWTWNGRTPSGNGCAPVCSFEGSSRTGSEVSHVSFELSLQSPRVTATARRLLSVMSRLPAGVARDDLEEHLPRGSPSALGALESRSRVLRAASASRARADSRVHAGEAASHAGRLGPRYRPLLAAGTGAGSSGGNREGKQGPGETRRRGAQPGCRAADRELQSTRAPGSDRHGARAQRFHALFGIRCSTYGSRPGNRHGASAT